MKIRLTFIAIIISLIVICPQPFLFSQNTTLWNNSDSSIFFNTTGKYSYNRKNLILFKFENSEVFNFIGRPSMYSLSWKDANRLKRNEKKKKKKKKAYVWKPEEDRIVVEELVQANEKKGYSEKEKKEIEKEKKEKLTQFNKRIFELLYYSNIPKIYHTKLEKIKREKYKRFSYHRLVDGVKNISLPYYFKIIYKFRGKGAQEEFYQIAMDGALEYIEKEFLKKLTAILKRYDNSVKEAQAPKYERMKNRLVTRALKKLNKKYMKEYHKLEWGCRTGAETKLRTKFPEKFKITKGGKEKKKKKEIVYSVRVKLQTDPLLIKWVMDFKKLYPDKSYILDKKGFIIMDECYGHIAEGPEITRVTFKIKRPLVDTRYSFLDYVYKKLTLKITAPADLSDSEYGEMWQNIYQTWETNTRISYRLNAYGMKFDKINNECNKRLLMDCLYQNGLGEKISEGMNVSCKHCGKKRSKCEGCYTNNKKKYQKKVNDKLTNWENRNVVREIKDIIQKDLNSYINKVSKVERSGSSSEEVLIIEDQQEHVIESDYKKLRVVTNSWDPDVIDDLLQEIMIETAAISEFHRKMDKRAEKLNKRSKKLYAYFSSIEENCKFLGSKDRRKYILKKRYKASKNIYEAKNQLKKYLLQLNSMNEGIDKIMARLRTQDWDLYRANLNSSDEEERTQIRKLSKIYKKLITELSILNRKLFFYQGYGYTVKDLLKFQNKFIDLDVDWNKFYIKRILFNTYIEKFFQWREKGKVYHKKVHIPSENSFGNSGFGSQSKKIPEEEEVYTLQKKEWARFNELIINYKFNALRYLEKDSKVAYFLLFGPDMVKTSGKLQETLFWLRANQVSEE